MTNRLSTIVRQKNRTLLKESLHNRCFDAFNCEASLDLCILDYKWVFQCEQNDRSDSYSYGQVKFQHSRLAHGAHKMSLYLKNKETGNESQQWLRPRCFECPWKKRTHFQQCESSEAGNSKFWFLSFISLPLEPLWLLCPFTWHAIPPDAYI